MNSLSDKHNKMYVINIKINLLNICLDINAPSSHAVSAGDPYCSRNSVVISASQVQKATMAAAGSMVDKVQRLN